MSDERSSEVRVESLAEQTEHLESVIAAQDQEYRDWEELVEGEQKSLDRTRVEFANELQRLKEHHDHVLNQLESVLFGKRERLKKLRRDHAAEVCRLVSKLSLLAYPQDAHEIGEVSGGS